jgi:hypothetical protein
MRDHLLLFLGRTAALAALLFTCGTASALEYDNGGSYQPQRHDRFLPGTFPGAPIANPDFLLGGVEPQLSGLGWQTDLSRRAVSLVSPRHFLNAAHYKASGTVSFVNRRGELRTYTVIDNRAVSGDVAIGTLAAPIPPEDEISFFPAVDDYASLASEAVYYFGNAPGNGTSAVGQTGVANSGSLLLLDSRLVAEAEAADRVRGADSDSGSPSFTLENDRLLLVGHHYFATADAPLASESSRDVIDAHLARDGYLLEITGEARLGEPQDAGLVVARLPIDRVVRFEAHLLGLAHLSPVRIYNFSQTDSVVELGVSGEGFSLVDASGAPGATSRSILVPANGSAVEAEVAFSAAVWGASSGLLSVSDASGSHEIVLEAQASEAGIGIADLSVSPYGQGGFAPSALYSGDTLRYDVQLTNHDDPGAATSAFQLGLDGPAGWNMAVQPSALSLAGGETGIATLSMTPVAGESPGVYDVEIQVDDGAEAAHSAAAGAIYEVLSDTQPPSPPADLGADGNHKRHKLTWAAATDDIRVAGYEVVRDGQPLGQTSNTGFTDTHIQRDAIYTYAVSAFDGASNRSAAVFVTVRNGVVQGGSSGGGGDAGDGGDGGTEDPAPMCPAFSPERGKRCSDGIDNDCDGLVDAADSDC